MYGVESKGGGSFFKQEHQLCKDKDSTNNVAQEKIRRHFQYVDVATVKKETDELSTADPAGTLGSQIIKQELQDEISVCESEACLWSFETSSLCDGESVKKEDTLRDHSGHLYNGSECATQLYKYAGLHSVIRGRDNMDRGIKFSEMNSHIGHISDTKCMESDKSTDAVPHKKEGSQERKCNWYRQVAIEEKTRLLQKKRDAARKRYRQMVGDEKVRFLQKKRDAIRDRYNKMTGEEKATILQKLRDARNVRYRQISGEQKAKILEKKRDAAKKRYRQMTGEEKVRFLQKKRDAVRNRNIQMVDEDKVHILKKKRTAARNRYRKMSDEEKERFLQRKRSEIKNRYRQKQVRRK